MSPQQLLRAQMGLCDAEIAAAASSIAKGRERLEAAHQKMAANLRLKADLVDALAKLGHEPSLAELSCGLATAGQPS